MEAHEVMSKKEACELWGIKHRNLEERLNQDNKNDREMYGTRKSGGTWFISRRYMEAKYGSQQ